MLSVLLLWAAVNVLTYISKKFNLSGTYMAMIISLVWGAIYFLATKYYIVEWQEIVGFITWIYATSQVVYGLLKKSWIIDKI